MRRHRPAERALLLALLLALGAPSAPVASASGPVLRTASAGDGDSWKASDGRTYRLGLVNAPELDECFGQQAAAYRRQRTQGGFTAQRYATDSYGRQVSVVRAGGGGNLGVDMARRGLVDDRYLARYRAEHPAYARHLDAAFAEAKRAGRGLWGACRSPRPAPAPAPARAAAPSRSLAPSRAPAPAPAPARCHPDYATCLPVEGDGSGRGAANDLDCGHVRTVVTLRRVGVDPYRLDSDRDGVGCESSG